MSFTKCYCMHTGFIHVCSWSDRTPMYFGFILIYLAMMVQGMIAGHAYYFLEDVYPRMTGRRPLKTPSFIKSLFADETIVARPADVQFVPPPQEVDRD